MKFIYLPTFVKRLKELSKKYPSLKNDFSSLLKELEMNSRIGTELGKDCYKIRLAIKSKGRGKSGGARSAPLLVFSPTNYCTIIINHVHSNGK